MSFIDYWDEYKKQFVYGVDYGLKFMRHCVCCSKNHFRNYFNSIVGFGRLSFDSNEIAKYDGIKVFFISKEIDLQGEWGDADEFTGWIYPSSSYPNYLFFLHNTQNNVMSSYQPHILSKTPTEYEVSYEVYKEIIKDNIGYIVTEFNKYKEGLRFATYKDIVNLNATLADFKKTGYYIEFIKRGK